MHYLLSENDLVPKGNALFTNRERPWLCKSRFKIMESHYKEHFSKILPQPQKLSSNSDEHKVNFVSMKVSTVHDPYIEEVFTGPPMKGQVLQPLGHFSS